MSEIPATSGDTKKQKTVSEKLEFEKFSVILGIFCQVGWKKPDLLIDL